MAGVEPYYADSHIAIYNKDCRSMDELSNESVQCVVTSPPYWGLRKYSGEQELIWGNNCEHQWGKDNTKEMNYVQGNPEFARPHREHKNFTATTNTCSLCGVWKGAYGLEPTPEMYIEHTVEILREIKRVLRKDGVVFLNIGDSYAGSGKGQNADGSPGKTGKLQRANRGTQVGGIPVSRFDKWNSDTPGSVQVSHDTPKANYKGMKPKDLCLIPFRVAIAAQEDGWWVRSVIIWSKPNPMPESVTDRPTESHEYILMLTKNSRYYWDMEAVREANSPDTHPYTAGGGFYKEDAYKKDINDTGQAKRMPIYQNPAGRNIRSVWEFPTQPYPEAHFAVFPEKLPEICIKAATPEVGCCSKCGAPWERITERDSIPTRPGYTTKREGNERNIAGVNARFRLQPQIETLGWQPTCKCNVDKVPSTVLDCFAGAGTTLWVAKKHNRKAVGYEISEEYCKLALERNRQQVML